MCFTERLQVRLITLKMKLKYNCQRCNKRNDFSESHCEKCSDYVATLCKRGGPYSNDRCKNIARKSNKEGWCGACFKDYAFICTVCKRRSYSSCSLYAVNCSDCQDGFM